MSNNFVKARGMVLLLILSMLITLTACGGGTSTPQKGIIGKWVSHDDSNSSVTFLKGGIMTAQEGEKSVDGKYIFTENEGYADFNWERLLTPITAGGLREGLQQVKIADDTLSVGENDKISTYTRAEVFEKKLEELQRQIIGT